MTESYRCIKEVDFGDIRADIKVLEKSVDENEKKIDRLKKKTESQNELSTAISVMSVTLEHIVEHSKRQDTVMENQNKTLENINTNLSQLSEGQRNLNQEQKNLNSKVAKLEERVSISESKSILDIRDIEKQKYMNILHKFAVPFGVGGGVALLIMEIIKILKG